MSALSARGPLPARMGLGRRALVLSLGLHVVFFVVTLGVPRLLASSPRAAPVYVVDLVSFGGGTPGPAAPPSGGKATPAPRPATPAPRPKKAPEKAIVIPERGAKKTAPKQPKKPAVKPEPAVKSEPTVKPEAAKSEAPEPGEAASAEAAGPADRQSAAAPAAGAPGGAPGGSGAGGQGTGVGGDAHNFYLTLLDRSIKGAWRRPLYSGTEILSATVRLEISRSGRVVKLDLVAASGLDALDRSVLAAVRDAEPFPPLPTTISLETMPVQIVFELNPHALGAGAPGE